MKSRPSGFSALQSRDGLKKKRVQTRDPLMGKSLHFSLPKKTEVCPPKKKQSRQRKMEPRVGGRVNTATNYICFKHSLCALPTWFCNQITTLQDTYILEAVSKSQVGGVVL